MTEFEGTTDNDLMLAACRTDEDEMLEDLLKESDIDLNHTDKLGDSALHYTARYGSFSCLELLVDMPDINVNLQNTIGNTPLHLAVQYAEDYELTLNMVELLIMAGANPNIKNRAKQSVVDYVKGRHDEMQEMIDSAAMSLLEEDSDEFI